MISVIMFLVVIMALACFVLYLAFVVASKNSEIDTLNDVIGSLARQHDKLADSLIQEQARAADLQDAYNDAQAELKRWQQQTEPMQLEEVKAPVKRTSRRKVATTKDERSTQ